MKRISMVTLFLVGLVLALVSLGPSVQADTPTVLNFSATPSSFGLGTTSATLVCMAQQSSPPGSFDPGDVSSIIFDSSLGTVTAVDSQLKVNSSTLAVSDFTAAQSAGNPNKIVITYTAGTSKVFGFGNSICANVHFNAAASSAAAIVRFSNKFTGTTGTLPSIIISIAEKTSQILPAGTTTTTLLFPFATNTSGFDTGIVISNTSLDTVGTVPQAGTCKLTYFGTGAPAAFTTPTAVQAGGQFVSLVSVLAPNFQGYIIATCNFQYAHGFAFVSDVGARNLAMGYLALVIPAGGRNPNGEQLVH